MHANWSRIGSLPSGGHSNRVRALFDDGKVRRNVGEESVDKLCSFEVPWYLAILLIDIVTDAWRIKIDTRDYKRLRGWWRTGPSKMRIPVASERHVTLFGWFSQRIGRCDPCSISDRGTCQLHVALLSPYWHNSPMRTSFIILGSGQDGGSPQVGRPSSVSRPRCASSVAVISSEGAVVLLDASPDLRAQSQTLLTSDLYPANRDSFVDGVCITHAHMGHYAGLLHFGTEAAAQYGLPLLGTARFLA